MFHESNNKFSTSAHPFSFKYIILQLVTILLLTSCSKISYYQQSIVGHLKVLSDKQPIYKLIQSQNISKEDKNTFKLLLKIKQFSVSQLALPKNDSYLDYADIKRKYILWNVIAAPKFNINLKKWCFYFAGCVSYRGYFNQQEAMTYSEQLTKQGYDTRVYGVNAYSTLGWFNDPFLSTMIRWKEERIAGVIFHELAHQLIYVKNDSTFNESFAMTVQQEGVKRWLKAQNKSQEYENMIIKHQQRQQLNNLVSQTREELNQLYKSKVSNNEKQQGKQQMIENLIKQYQQLKETWVFKNQYNFLFSMPINNAWLGSFTTYWAYIPAFQKLLQQNNNDLVLFYQEAKKIAEMLPPERQKKLNELSKI